MEETRRQFVVFRYEPPQRSMVQTSCDFSGMEDDELSVEEWEKEVKRGYYEIEELNEGVKLRVGWIS